MWAPFWAHGLPQLGYIEGIFKQQDHMRVDYGFTYNNILNIVVVNQVKTSVGLKRQV